MYLLLSFLILVIIGILLYSYYHKTAEMFKGFKGISKSSSRYSAPRSTTTTTTTVIQQPRSSYSYPVFIPFWSSPTYYAGPSETVVVSNSPWSTFFTILFFILFILLFVVIIVSPSGLYDDSFIVTTTTTTTK